MTLKELEAKLKGNYEVTKMTHLESFVLGLGKKGAVTIQFKNGQFTKLLVDGNDKENIQKVLNN